MTRFRCQEVRRFVAEAEEVGFVFEGLNAMGHLRLRHVASNRLLVAPSKLGGHRRHAYNTRGMLKRFISAQEAG